MSENKEEIRYILKFLYKKEMNATQATNEICKVYGDDAVSVRVAQQWFARFRAGNFVMKDAPRTGRPTNDNVDEIMKMIHHDPHKSSHDIAKELSVHHQTVLNHLKKAGYEKKLDVWRMIMLKLEKFALYNELEEKALPKTMAINVPNPIHTSMY